MNEKLHDKNLTDASGTPFRAGRKTSEARGVAGSARIIRQSKIRHDCSAVAPNDFGVQKRIAGANCNTEFGRTNR